LEHHAQSAARSIIVEMGEGIGIRFLDLFSNTRGEIVDIEGGEFGNCRLLRGINGHTQAQR
jgi:hypothetical protein